MCMFDFKKVNVDTDGRTSGKLKTYCPQCRDSRSNKRDKSLSLQLDLGLGKCHYCGWSFSLTAIESDEERQQRRNRKALSAPAAHFQRPVFDRNRTQLSEKLVRWFVEERCIPQEILTRMQIGEHPEFMPQTGQKENCACFHYFEEGTLINTKFRDARKHFKLVSGAELIPYNIDAIRDTPECIITEGEIDALSFMAIGRNDVVSAPAGASHNLSWLDRFVESHFENKRVIYIASDSDEKGEVLCRELIRRFGAGCCRVVSYGPGCKDANEHLVRYGVESLRIALAQAKEIPLEGVFTTADCEEELRTLFLNGFEKGADTGLEHLDKLCTFELGRLCVVTGIPGSGKSEFTDELMLRLCLRHGWKAAFFSPENMPLIYHMRKHIERLTGCRFHPRRLPEPLYNKAVRFLSENVYHILPEEDYTLDTILEKARELIRRRGIRLLVLDPFNRFDHQMSGKDSETNYIGNFLSRLLNFAVRHQCLVTLVAHPKKMDRDRATGRYLTPSLYDINGSANFKNICDFGLVVERDKAAGVARVHVEKVRFRQLGTGGTASFVFDTTNGRYLCCEEHPTAPNPKDRIVNVKYDSTCWLPEETPPENGSLHFK